MHRKRAVQEPTTSRQRDREAGLIGRFLGASSEKAGNVAGLFVITSMFMLVILALCETSADPGELRQLFSAFATAGLGFLFGRRA